jgi:SAM-dependent methyltransferase
VTIHEHAAAGFSRRAAEYERGRPGYPPEAVDFLERELRLGPGRTLLDLAAGTGKLTRLLVPTGAEVVAVEPVDEMRAELERAVPGVRALAGTAEAIPLADASVDAVTVAQAFHWFAGERALRELQRVLRPGERLALVWNVRDFESAVWLEPVEALVDGRAGDLPRHRSGRWRAAFDDTELFGPLRHAAFAHPQEVEREAFVARTATISYIGALPDEEREHVLDEVRALLPDEPVLRFAYRTDVFVCERR